MNATIRSIALRALDRLEGELKQQGSYSDMHECLCAARHAARVGDIQQSYIQISATMAMACLPELRAERAAAKAACDTLPED